MTVSAPTLPLEHPPPPGPATPLTGQTRRPFGPGAGPAWVKRLLRADALWWPTLLVAGFACFVAFLPKGGLNLESLTTTELVLTLAGGVVAALAIIFTPAARSLLEGRKYGLWPLALLLAFTALSGLSVAWSVQPDASYQDAARLLAYSAVFGAAIALVRLAPERWPAILGGLALGAAVVCGYALATKVFPGKLAPVVSYARLEEPYGYWNAIGLTAALGTIACMWLGARRTGHALLNALAYPAIGIMLVTLMLAYSRGALAALAVGLVLWFGMVPLRLRGATVLIVAVLGAGAVVAWDFTQHALTTNNVALGERASAGHQLGALLLVMLVGLTLAGVAIGFFGARRPRSAAARTRTGAILIALVVVALVGFVGALAASHRGLTGSISHAVSTVTNPNAKPPPNTPGRLTAVASVRARYWKEALQVFAAHPAVGAGAGGYETARLRYRTAPLEVKHAHGFVVQTLADLGALGLALALALLIAWMACAGRATHPFNRRWTSWRAWLDIRAGARPGWHSAPEPYAPERIGLLCMICLVVAFGVHSFVDWTWYVPGNACVALLCAGWLAARGPLEIASAEPSATREWTLVGPPGVTAAHAHSPGADTHDDSPGETETDRLTRLARGRLNPMRVGVAAAVLIAALLAAWAQAQPQRSVDAAQEALALLARDPRAALASAHTAVARDPLSAQALLTLATVQQATGDEAQARATLERGVREQPANPVTWLALGRYQLPREPASAVKTLEAAIYLNPESISPEQIADGNPEAIAIRNAYIRALRASGRAGGAESPTAGADAATGAVRSAAPLAGASALAAGARRAARTGPASRAPTRAGEAPRPAAAGARRAARRRGLLSVLGIRTSRERR